MNSSRTASEEQIDELLGHLVGKLRRRIQHMPFDQAQYLVGDPNNRIADPVAETLLENWPENREPRIVLMKNGIKIPDFNNYRLSDCLKDDGFILSEKTREIMRDLNGIQPRLCARSVSMFR